MPMPFQIMPWFTKSDDVSSNVLVPSAKRSIPRITRVFRGGGGDAAP